MLAPNFPMGWCTAEVEPETGACPRQPTNPHGLCRRVSPPWSHPHLASSPRCSARLQIPKIADQPQLSASGVRSLSLPSKWHPCPSFPAARAASSILPRSSMLHHRHTTSLPPFWFTDPSTARVSQPWSHNGTRCSDTSFENARHGCQKGIAETECDRRYYYLVHCKAGNRYRCKPCTVTGWHSI